MTQAIDQEKLARLIAQTIANFFESEMVQRDDTEMSRAVENDQACASCGQIECVCAVQLDACTCNHDARVSRGEWASGHSDYCPVAIELLKRGVPA